MSAKKGLSHEEKYSEQSNYSAIKIYSNNNYYSAGVINENEKTISVVVPFGTNINNLNPRITHTGASCSPNGAQNFTNPVVYTVTAKDGTKQEYTVTVSMAGLNDKAITAFSFETISAIGIINENAKTISVTVPFGTNVSNLRPAILHTGKSISPNGSVNFNSPVIFTVTASNNTTQAYTVSVRVAANDEKSITDFYFGNIQSESIIDEEAKTIVVNIPPGTNVTNLTPVIIHTGKSYSPQGARNFSSPQTYTITAVDNSTQSYTVTVEAAYIVTMQKEGNGNVLANPGITKSGTSVTITATPESGYEFIEWQVVSGSISLSDLTANPAVFTMPSGNVTIKAIFESLDTPRLVISPLSVIFAAEEVGYSQPEAKTITLNNSKTVEANVSNIESNSESFILNGTSSIGIVAANNGNAEFTVQPKPGLSAGIHNAVIIVTYNNNATVQTNVSFTVVKKDPIVNWPSGLTTPYGNVLSDITLPDNKTGTLGTFTWTTPGNSVGNAGVRSHNMTFTPDDTAVFNTKTQNITINVLKAAGIFGSPAAINTTYTPGLTLANLTLPAGYVWNVPSTPLNAGNGQSFAATYTDPSGNYEPESGNVTVNIIKATGSFGSPAAVGTTYTPGLTLANLTLPAGYVWNAPATSLNAGDNQPFTATYTNPNGNYEPASENITVNISKAAGSFGSPAAVGTTYTPGLTLANLTLPAGYTWNVPTTALSAGNNQTFPATYTNPSGNNEPAIGNITVNIAKAAGTFGSPAAVGTTYTPGLTLANLTLPAGYVWNAPTTPLNAGNNQTFPATYTNPNGNYEPADGNITVNVEQKPEINLSMDNFSPTNAGEGKFSTPIVLNKNNPVPQPINAPQGSTGIS